MKPTFSAALLAGGKSTRMGEDKALLPLPNSGLPLWRHQLSILESLHPEKIFWSGLSRPGLPHELEIVADAYTNAGPLAGVSACLHLVQTDLLIVLAIDLPGMTASFLENLLRQCSPARGGVIRRGNCFEPLAAIYPRQLCALARAHLESGRYALQDFICVAIELGKMRAIPLSERDQDLFQNWNSPSDIPGVSGSRI